MNVAVLGLGRGSALAEAVMASERLRLVAGVDPEPDRRDRAKAAGVPPERLHECLDDALDATQAEMLVVATPNRMHPEHVVAGLEAGLHVLCEKPLATSREDARAIEDAARRCGRRVAVIQNMRFVPEYARCRDLVRDGAVGELSLIEMNFRKWRPPRGLDHAVLFNHGVHHLDAIRSIVAGTVRRLDAVEWNPAWARDEGSGRYLRLTALMEEGWAVAYNASYAETGDLTPHAGLLRITGSKGTLETGGEPDIDPWIVLHRAERATGEESHERIDLEPLGWRAIDRMIVEGFAQSAARGEAFETDIEDNLKTLEWLFLAEESIARACPAAATAQKGERWQERSSG